jgi:hypothetical protein
MLIESVTGLVEVRLRMIVLRFGDAMREPLFGGVAFGLAACGALSGDPQIDDLSHASALVSPTPSISAPITPIRWRYPVRVRPLPECGRFADLATHGWVNKGKRFASA